MCYKYNYIITILQNVDFNLREEDIKKIEKKQKTYIKNTDMKSIDSVPSERSKCSDADLLKKNNIMTINKNKPSNNNNNVIISNEKNIDNQESGGDMMKEKYEQKIKEIIEEKDKEIKNIINIKNSEIDKLKESTRRSLSKRSTHIQLNNRNIQFELQPQILNINDDIEIYKSKNKYHAEELIQYESKFTNWELNNMDFESSKLYDKRNLCQLYCSYLNEKNLLIFLFSCYSLSSISVYTKIIIFLQKIMVYFLVFVLFFGTKSVSKIYEEKFDLIEKIKLCFNITPLIMILNSFIHNLTYNTFYQKISEIKVLFYNSSLSSKKYFEILKNSEMSEEMILKKQLKEETLTEEEKEIKAIKEMTIHLFKYFRNKLCLDFFLMIFWMIGEWYIVTSFCSVYKNSQIEFFITLIVSFVISIIIPFIYCFILALLRKIAISGNSKCFYYLLKLFRFL